MHVYVPGFLVNYALLRMIRFSDSQHSKPNTTNKDLSFQGLCMRNKLLHNIRHVIYLSTLKSFLRSHFFKQEHPST